MREKPFLRSVVRQIANIACISVIALSFGCPIVSETYTIRAIADYGLGPGFLGIVVMMEGHVVESYFTVTVNGTPLSPADTNFYHGTLENLIPGDNVTLSIQGNGENIEETLSIPYPTDITSPNAYFSHDATQPLFITWDEVAPEHPDSIYFSAYNFYEYGTEWTGQKLPGSATSGSIPENIFPPGMSDLYFDLVLRNSVVLTGANADAGSSFETTVRVSSVYFSTE